VLAGGRLTREDAYAYAKFARVALGTHDVDFRARPHSAEEAEFLAAHVAGTGLGVTYDDLEQAPAVFLVGFEPEDESPIVFLRLRKAARDRGTRVVSIAPTLSRGLEKMSGTVLPAVPGDEPAVLAALADGATALGQEVADAAALLRVPGAVLLVGERLSGVAGGLSAAAALSAATGARLAWVPRRAGERGALDAGAFPTLLPGGRPVADATAAAAVAAAWGIDADALPTAPGRDTAAILAAAADGTLGALVIGGVELADLPDPALAQRALESAAFVVSLEVKPNAITAMADVVLPVAVASEKAGTFVDWEGRDRPFARVFDTAALSDTRALSTLADAMDLPIYLVDTAVAARELAELGTHAGPRSTAPQRDASAAPRPGDGEAVLASWRQLLDRGALQQGEPHLAATARRPVARLSGATAARLGLADGEQVSVSTDAGVITLPLVVSALADDVVWVPAHSPGSSVLNDLGVDPTVPTLVRVSQGTSSQNGGAA
jgi:NADH-quinone oxidoreductase subunit G